MKTILKVIFAILGVILLLIIGIVAYIGISVSDKTDNTSKKIIEDNKSTIVLVNEYGYNALQINDNKEANFLLTEEEMNYLLYSISKNINIPKVKIKSIYCTYNSDQTFSVYAPATAFGFKSCVKATAKIVEDNGTITLTISNLSIGKLSTKSFLIKNFVVKNINFDKTEAMLKDKDIYLDLDKKDNGDITAIVTKADIVKMIDRFKDNDNYYLYLALVNEFVGNDTLINLDFNEDQKIGASLYLKSLVYTNTLTYNLDTGATSIKNDITTLIDNDICNVNNVSLVFDYLVRGYDDLSDKKKEEIEKLDLSSISITNNKSYKGIKTKSNITMKDLFKSFRLKSEAEIINALLNAYYDIIIPEEKVNAILNDLSFVGTSFALKNGNNVAYIIIDSLFIEVNDNALDIYLVLDVNGEMIYAKIATTAKSNGSYNLVLTIDSINLGENKVDEKTKEYLLNYLANVVSVDFLKIDTTNQTVELDFVSYITEDDFFTYIINKKFKNNKIILSSNNNGEILIRLSA